ncbi:MAG: ABC transporter ATP-binding protein/permease [Rhodoferax sp.]|nr:ABC transporter ATP-binding protein/permease [Rhodoferax sp.]
MQSPLPTSPLLAASPWSRALRQVRRVWALSWPYFFSEEKWRARAMLAAIVALNLALVYMAVLFNDWNKLFYDALQEKNQAVFWTQLGRFSYLAFAFIVIAVYKFYLTQLLEMRWRSWMTRHTLQRWLSGQAFYRLELARFGAADPALDATPDNPDQRIAEDINQFTALTLGLSMGLLNSVVTLASFVGILWGLSGGFAFHVGAQEYNIPGFMVWMALLYCAAGSWLTHLIGRPQIGLNFAQQRVEADFRHHMIRVREYSESIALDRGETVERSQMESRFGEVMANYLRLIRAQKNLVWFTSFFGQAAVVFPFVVAAPRFFSGAIQLGELMQISSAFGQVQGALSWFVDSYPNLASWRATTDRLTHFEASLQRLEAAPPATALTPNSDLRTQDLRVALPSGVALLAHTALHAEAGERVLLRGPSGAGKSTLFRALAGIWPFASGTVARPLDTMFIPQRPYFPNGPLRDALAYPELPARYSDSQLQEALQWALLPDLALQLDHSDLWGQKLSGGEQQRLALARVYLKQPQWVFADEATSALDPDTETTLYQRLVDLLAQRGGGLVSIAHRPDVARFHTKTWLLEPQPDPAGARFAVVEKAL